MTRLVALLILLLSSVMPLATAALASPGGSGSHGGGSSGGGGAHASAGTHAGSGGGHAGSGSHGSTANTGSHVIVAARPAHAAAAKAAREATVAPERPPRPPWWRRLFHHEGFATNNSPDNNSVRCYFGAERNAPGCPQTRSAAGMRR